MVDIKKDFLKTALLYGYGCFYVHVFLCILVNILEKYQLKSDHQNETTLLNLFLHSLSLPKVLSVSLLFLYFDNPTVFCITILYPCKVCRYC